MTSPSDRYPGGRHRRLDAGPAPSTPAASPTGTSGGPTGTGGRDVPPPTAHPVRAPRTVLGRRFRPRSIRARVVALLAVPVVAVMALWGLATVTEVRAAYAAQQINALKSSVEQPMADAATALESERAQAVRFLTQGSASALSTPAVPAATTAAAASAAPGIEPTSADPAVAAARTGAAAASVPLDTLSPDLRTRVRAALANFDALPQVQQRVSTRTITPADAYAAYTTDIEDARAVGTTITAIRAASDASTGTRIGSLLGLPVILLSLLVSVRIGRGLVVELVGLRDTALELAGRRLPDAIARLRAGGSVDLDVVAPLPAPDPAPEDEVGQVAEALAVVQRAALEAATERAEVVSGVARVFLNLARRSQVLVHQQLSLLDAMERRVDDPEEIEDLYRLDHLATRMRRHAEGLIILSGSPPGRAWRRPVPLIDVLRSAAAEVEDFSRVDVRPTPRARVVGPAVADLTHLVAELVENATAFSPPYTRVTVRAALDGAVCVVEVEDRGLGMGDEALADANRRIADARPGDLFDSEQLGLFVVSRLARRLQVQVRLQRTAAGGTTAIVALPESVLVVDELTEHGEHSNHDDHSDRGEAVVSSSRTAPGLEADRGAEAAESSSSAVVPSSAEFASAASAAGPRSAASPDNASSGLLSTSAAPPSPPNTVLASTATTSTDPPPGPASKPASRPGAHRGPSPTPDNPLPGAAEARPPASVVAPETTAAGLPRRVRQANMAPQLRDRAQSGSPSGTQSGAGPGSQPGAQPRPDTSEPPAPDPQDGPPAPRDPESVRATMAAFQSGWTRGRHGDPERKESSP